MSIPVIQKATSQNPLLNAIKHGKANFILTLNKTGLIELSISPKFRTYDSEKSIYPPFLGIKCLKSSSIKVQKTRQYAALKLSLMSRCNKLSLKIRDPSFIFFSLLLSKIDYDYKWFV
ncbi:hypothetical protein EAE91_10915 [Photorhabdus noenieputensis]|nr:hypothetical protein [Photorhabdus noenieputensis]